MMVIALVGIWAIFGAISGGTYLLPRNMSNLFRQSVFTAILAIGMLNVIVLGQIDLSVGSIAGLCGGILAIANVWKGMSPLVSIAITLAAGLLLGPLERLVDRLPQRALVHRHHGGPPRLSRGPGRHHGRHHHRAGQPLFRA